MNHRDLIQSANKNRRFSFQTLPEDLQDAIIDGLDSETLTLCAAADLVAARGLKLSHEAIAQYHRAVRRERRLRDLNDSMGRTLEAFQGRPVEANLQALLNLLLAGAADVVASGDLELKPVDLMKLAEILKPAPPAEPAPNETASVGTVNEQALPVTQETLDGVRNKLLLGR